MASTRILIPSGVTCSHAARWGNNYMEKRCSLLLSLCCYWSGVWWCIFGSRTGGQYRLPESWSNIPKGTGDVHNTLPESWSNTSKGTSDVHNTLPESWSNTSKGTSDVHNTLPESWSNTSKGTVDVHNTLHESWSNTSKGTADVHNTLPESWSSTLKGFTVDCCNGSPNTKHWPQQIDVTSDEFTLDSSLGIHEDATKRKKSFVGIFRKRTWE